MSTNLAFMLPFIVCSVCHGYLKLHGPFRATDNWASTLPRCRRDAKWMINLVITCNLYFFIFAHANSFYISDGATVLVHLLFDLWVTRNPSDLKTRHCVRITHTWITFTCSHAHTANAHTHARTQTPLCLHMHEKNQIYTHTHTYNRTDNTQW